MSSGGDYPGSPARPRSSLWDGILSYAPWRRNSDTAPAPAAAADAGRAEPEPEPVPAAVADDQREPPAEGESSGEEESGNSGDEDDDGESDGQQPESGDEGNQNDDNVDNNNRVNLTYHVSAGRWHTEMVFINKLVVYSANLPITKNGRVLTFQIVDDSEGAGSVKQMFITSKGRDENIPAKLYICFPKAQKNNEDNGEQKDNSDNSQQVSPFIEIYYMTPEDDSKLEEVEARLEDGVLTINLPDGN